MKKLFLALILGLTFANVAMANDSYGNVTQTGATTGRMFFLKEAVAPVTYTPTTLVGPGVVVTKILASGSAAALTYSVQLWDAPNGITGSAGARRVLWLEGTTQAPYIYDLTSQKGARTDTDGIYFKYYPTVVSISGLDFPKLTLMYQPAGQNATRPIP